MGFGDVKFVAVGYGIRQNGPVFPENQTYLTISNPTSGPDLLRSELIMKYTSEGFSYHSKKMYYWDSDPNLVQMHNLLFEDNIWVDRRKDFDGIIPKGSRWDYPV